ncbi:MAG: extracellular solute-binding protein [Treponema sp.]|nr:extracellular solute-binding protein [Treponema sp.]
MKKISIVLAAALMIVSFAFGGGNKAAGSAAPAGAPAATAPKGTVRIAWLGLSPDDRIDPISGITYKGSYALKDMIEKKLPGVKIEFVMIPNDNWIQKMQTTIEAGDADIGWYTNQVMAPDWFVDHRDFMKTDPKFSEADFEKTFTPGAKFYTRYRSFDYPEATNAIYGLPYDASAYYIVYDSQMFKQWGVQPLSQKPTFDEISQAAKKMTGKNPVTGQQNYGIYLVARWSEWLGVGSDMYPVVTNPTMDITKLDTAKYVDVFKNSPTVLNYFQFLLDMIACAPAGVVNETGFEQFYTANNNIGIMLDTSRTQTLYNYMQAKDKSVTDRFIPVLLPRSATGVSSFPEIHKIAVTKQAKDKNLAWQVVKTICMDKDILNLLASNYAVGNVPALVDTSGIDIMKDSFTALRYQDRQTGTFISDDYWYWRDPIRSIFSNVFAGKLTAAQARDTFYNGVTTWVSNKIKQKGK